jgi:type IV secretion system protein VirB10
MSERTPAVDGDRTRSPAAGQGWWTKRRAMTIGGCSLMALMAFIVWKIPASKPDKSQLPEKPTLAFATQNPYKPPPAEDITPAKKAEAPPLSPAKTDEPKSDIDKATRKPNNGSSNDPVFYSYVVPPLPDSFKAGKQKASGAGSNSENNPDNDTIAFKSPQIPGIEAGSMGNTTLMLPPGILTCTMSSVVESTVEGQFTCTIPNDVKSPKNVTLISGGAYIQGQYDIRVQTGQRRLRANTLALWDIKANCVTPMNGMMSDALGRAGLDGDYDPHTWEKLGGAAVVMLTQNAFSLLQAAIQSQNHSSGNNSYFQFNTGDMSSIATELLRQNAHIPPTITTHQGSVAGFWVTQPIRFIKCFRLATTD